MATLRSETDIADNIDKTVNKTDDEKLYYLMLTILTFCIYIIIVIKFYHNEVLIEILSIITLLIVILTTFEMADSNMYITIMIFSLLISNFFQNYTNGPVNIVPYP